MCLSFYAAIDEALDAGDVRRLRLLWEVSNQVIVRLLLSPTQDQIVHDRLAISDQLRVKFSGSGVQSFFDMSVDVVSLTCADAASGAQVFCPKLISLMKVLGVTHKGKPIDKGFGHAMLSCMVFVLDEYCREVVLLLERVDPTSFDDHTKVMRRCKSVRSSISVASSWKCSYLQWSAWR